MMIYKTVACTLLLKKAKIRFSVVYSNLQKIKDGNDRLSTAIKIISNLL